MIAANLAPLGELIRPSDDLARAASARHRTAKKTKFPAINWPRLTRRARRKARQPRSRPYPYPSCRHRPVLDSISTTELRCHPTRVKPNRYTEPPIRVHRRQSEYLPRPLQNASIVGLGPSFIVNIRGVRSIRRRMRSFFDSHLIRKRPAVWLTLGCSLALAAVLAVMAAGIPIDSRFVQGIGNPIARSIRGHAGCGTARKSVGTS